MSKDDPFAQFKTHMAYLCDSMKRLEKAIASSDDDTRDYYLDEARERREKVERWLLGGNQKDDQK